MSRRGRQPGASIDWQAVRARLARAHAAAQAALALSPERGRAVMDERARALARLPAQATAPGEVIEVLTFALGRERYAMATRLVREVVRLVDFTPVPGAPAFVLGITNLRGAVLPIIDLQMFFGIAERGMTDRSHIIVLGADEGELGILVDAAHAVERLPVADVLAPPESVAGIGRASLRGVTRDALIVLDGEALLGDERLILDDT